MERDPLTTTALYTLITHPTPQRGLHFVSNGEGFTDGGRFGTMNTEAFTSMYVFFFAIFSYHFSPLFIHHNTTHHNHCCCYYTFTTHTSDTPPHTHTNGVHLLHPQSCTAHHTIPLPPSNNKIPSQRSTHALPLLYLHYRHKKSYKHTHTQAMEPLKKKRRQKRGTRGGRS